jgi:hypothetical protein
LWDGETPDDAANSTLLPNAFLGTIRQRNDDGKPVVMIDGWKRFDCGTTGGGGP